MIHIRLREDYGLEGKYFFECLMSLVVVSNLRQAYVQPTVYVIHVFVNNIFSIVNNAVYRYDSKLLRFKQHIEQLIMLTCNISLSNQF